MFHQFQYLPPELRIQIWQAACPQPGIHVFDVCIPSISQACQTQDGRTQDERRFEEFRDAVFLDSVKISQYRNPARPVPNQHSCEEVQFSFDPSTSRVASSIRRSCFEASNALQMLSGKLTQQPANPAKSLTPGIDSNLVYLPGKDKWMAYSNRDDVLFLRFGSPVSIPDPPTEPGYHRAFSSGLSDVLLCPWSAEFAESLRNARRVAIDVTEIHAVHHSEEAIYQEVAYLSCCLHSSLEVLYIVDHCVGHCERCGKDKLSIKSLQQRGQLANQFNPDSIARRPDIFHGNGLTYHEIFSWEKLGWSEDHPTCVRVLVCEYD
ncbi:hypothetical protein PMAA_016880 [Talaromyces marneffei ATCC 18224]|uniref:2EXR domain-containing protein n=1 Tax=Talaromyces marneffei (strain ATCC 18224 / CBS 334.59 / QM 7333) TaxID=441960 RepID=B6Q1A6_TALMQ|nr:hypothetical protein PMAA_016880 [Talaromyces marneffei ATCC 18224]